MERAALHNLGCKVNAYEMDAMQEMLERAGYRIVPFDEKADLYIINTCTVTNIADRKSRQMLHRARKMNPDAVVVATGCYAQIQSEEDKSIDPAVDLVIGNNRKKDLISIIEEYKKTRGENKAQEYVTDINHTKEYEELNISSSGGHTRAYIKVQDGCNQFCSYCIIPYARGRSRSRRKEDVVREVERLAALGYKEIVLTGIHLSSYGAGLEEKESLLSLIAAVHKVDGIERIRLGSLEPGIITEEFVKTISSMPKLCPHFHLSLQSGCDETLKRMNRRYTSKEYFEKCLILRKYFDCPALTTDVIVGFPGETEEEFECSRAFVEKVGFYETHIFKYSRRNGTKAAKMEGQIPEPVKAKRSDILIELGKRQKKHYEDSFRGKEVEVLVEEEIRNSEKRIQAGHTREYLKISLVSDKELKNRLVKLQIPQDFDFSDFCIEI